ncbi:uncharacterized protein VTP21DRAFT_11416 [Calcarisporiella thermophila]|uniref:uncharacterized protein n=1 Tax=Calcarisporiella thermophila TaxID=911321 RepID=UPI0037444B1F
MPSLSSLVNLRISLKKSFLPARTDISENIEFVTHYTQTTINWNIVSAIVSKVHERGEIGAWEAAKCVTRRLMSGDGLVVDLSVQVLRSFVENCGRNFHLRMMRRSFIHAVNFCYFHPKTTGFAKQSIKETLFYCKNIFSGYSEFEDIVSVYAPIFQHGNIHSTSAILTPPISNSRLQLPPPQPAVNKIRSDMALALNNCQILAESLSFSNPDSDDIQHNELIKEFYEKCKKYQSLIVAYIEKRTEEELLVDLLEVNQQLLQVLRQYEDVVERHAIISAKHKSLVDLMQTHIENEVLARSLSSTVEDNYPRDDPGSSSTGNPTSSARAIMRFEDDPFSDKYKLESTEAGLNESESKPVEEETGESSTSVVVEGCARAEEELGGNKLKKLSPKALGKRSANKVDMVIENAA